MFIDNFIVPIASVAYLISKSREKRLKYKINFKYLPKNWLQAKMIIEMDKVWKKEGLDAIGMNYFTVGALEDGLSSRYNPENPYYQSWLGGYIVEFNQKREWSISDHFRLGEADQKNWLVLFGDHKPKVKIDYDHFDKLGDIKISGFDGQLYRGNIYSDSDVGKGKISFYGKLQIAALAFYLNKSNPKLNLKYKNLVPIWTDKNMSDSYQYILLTGYIAILNISESIKAVLYVNAAKFKDKTGKNHDNFKKLDQELLKLIKGIEIQKVKP